MNPFKKIRSNTDKRCKFQSTDGRKNVRFRFTDIPIKWIPYRKILFQKCRSHLNKEVNYIITVIIFVWSYNILIIFMWNTKIYCGSTIKVLYNSFQISYSILRHNITIIHFFRTDLWQNTDISRKKTLKNDMDQR